MVPAGRRSGKTELAKRKLVLSLTKKKAWSDPRYFAAAPTRDQAKRIFWQDLLRLIPKSWIKGVSKSDLCIRTKFGSELWVVGLDKPQRIEGTPWDGGVLDEFGNMHSDSWGQHIRPALSDRKGWCWIIGVPEGLNHYKELVDYASSGKDQEWGYYTWPSSEVLSAEELDSARRLLDPRTFRQEYEASFEGAAGRVYYAYDQKIHEDRNISLKEGLPVFLCCDFNVELCVWVVVQFDGEKVFAIDEIAKTDTNTFEMADEARRRYGRHGAGVVVYGDSAGDFRSTAGQSDYAILRMHGFTDQRIQRANPPVKDRINALNALLLGADGKIRFAHHPSCVRLRADLETVVWTSDGAGLDKSNIKSTHASDALGYYVYRRFGLNVKGPDPGRRFYK